MGRAGGRALTCRRLFHLIAAGFVAVISTSSSLSIMAAMNAQHPDPVAQAIMRERTRRLLELTFQAWELRDQPPRPNRKRAQAAQRPVNPERTATGETPVWLNTAARPLNYEWRGFRGPVF